MATRSKITVNWPANFSNPTWAPFGISTVATFADWLDAKYLMLIAWTGYDPAERHGAALTFEHFQSDEPTYDPNTRRVNIPSVNSRRQPWFDTWEFFAYCLHEMAHDFTRWDEQYCQQRVGIEPLMYAQYCQSVRKREIDNLIEAMCEYFK